MKTHYDPYMYEGTSGAEGDGEEYCVEYDRYLCGSHVNFDEDIKITANWNRVTCEKCLKQKIKIDTSVNETEKAIVGDMGKMADWWEQEKKLTNK